MFRSPDETYGKEVPSDLLRRILVFRECKARQGPRKVNYPWLFCSIPTLTSSNECIGAENYVKGYHLFAAAFFMDFWLETKVSDSPLDVRKYQRHRRVTD